MISRLVKSVLLIAAATFITFGVVTDFENCDKVESRCFYLLLVPAFLPVYFVTYMAGWTGLQLYKYN